MKNRHIEQWNKIKSPETVSHKNSLLIFDKRLKAIEGNKHNLFNKWYWNNWVYTCEKKKNRNLNTKLKPFTKIHRPRCKAQNYKIPRR